MRRFKQTLIAIDQLFSAIILGNADETFSSACHRLGKNSKGWKRVESFVDLLFFWDYEIIGTEKIKHCQLSFGAELRKAHFPEFFRGLK